MQSFNFAGFVQTIEDRNFQPFQTCGVNAVSNSDLFAVQENFARQDILDPRSIADVAQFHVIKVTAVITFVGCQEVCGAIDFCGGNGIRHAHPHEVVIGLQVNQPVVIRIKWYDRMVLNAQRHDFVPGHGLKIKNCDGRCFLQGHEKLVASLRDVFRFQIELGRFSREKAHASGFQFFCGELFEAKGLHRAVGRVIGQRDD